MAERRMFDPLTDAETEAVERSLHHLGKTGPVGEFVEACTDPPWKPEDYAACAIEPIGVLGWLARRVEPEDHEAATQALYGAMGEKRPDNQLFPFVVLWVLRLNGCLKPVEGLDEQLVEWRAWMETRDDCSEFNNTGEYLWWLPSFPEETR